MANHLTKTHHLRPFSLKRYAGAGPQCRTSSKWNHGKVWDSNQKAKQWILHVHISFKLD